MRLSGASSPYSNSNLTSTNLPKSSESTQNIQPLPNPGPDSSHLSSNPVSKNPSKNPQIINLDDSVYMTTKKVKTNNNTKGTILSNNKENKVQPTDMLSSLPLFPPPPNLELIIYLQMLQGVLGKTFLDQLSQPVNSSPDLATNVCTQLLEAQKKNYANPSPVDISNVKFNRNSVAENQKVNLNLKNAQKDKILKPRISDPIIISDDEDSSNIQGSNKFKNIIKEKEPNEPNQHSESLKAIIEQKFPEKSIVNDYILIDDTEIQELPNKSNMRELPIQGGKEDNVDLKNCIMDENITSIRDIETCKISIDCRMQLENAAEQKEDVCINLESQNQIINKIVVDSAHQAVIPSFKLNRRKLNKKVLKLIWKPVLIDSDVFSEYMRRIEDKLGHPVTNQEKAVKVLTKFELNIENALNNIEKNKGFYRNYFSMNQRSLRKRQIFA